MMEIRKIIVWWFYCLYLGVSIQQRDSFSKSCAWGSEYDIIQTESWALPCDCCRFKWQLHSTQKEINSFWFEVSLRSYLWRLNLGPADAIWMDDDLPKGTFKYWEYAARKLWCSRSTTTSLPGFRKSLRGQKRLIRMCLSMPGSCYDDSSREDFHRIKEAAGQTTSNCKQIPKDIE